MDPSSERSAGVMINNLEIAPNWGVPLANLVRLVPDGILVGGAALGLQLAARHPEVSHEFFRADGPNDLDMICPDETLTTLAKAIPVRGEYIETDITPPFDRSHSAIPEQYYLRIRDRATNIETDLIHIAAGAPPCRTGEMTVNGVRVRVLSAEELYLQRLFLVTGYERQGRENLFKAPTLHHFKMLEQSAEIVDPHKLTDLFEDYKSRVKMLFNVDLVEATWEELRMKAGAVMSKP